MERIDISQINLDEFRHSLPVQIRFNDIDILGHLNNIVYFAFYDLAKARFLQTVKKGNIDFRKVECVIANINCAYIKQILFGEEIEVLTKCIHIGDRSFILRQCLIETGSREIRSVCDTVMVAFDPKEGKSVPMSPELRKALLDYENCIDIVEPPREEVIELNITPER